MDPLERLIIKDACQSISVQFGRLQDERRHDDLAGLMTADACYVRLGEELAVDAFIEWIKTTPPNKTRHFVTPTVFSIVKENLAKGGHLLRALPLRWRRRDALSVGGAIRRRRVPRRVRAHG